MQTPHLWSIISARLAWWLDGILDRSPAGTRMIPGVARWTVPCNWKLPVEQFTSDFYHFPVTHASAIAAMRRGRRAAGRAGVQRHAGLSSLELVRPRLRLVLVHRARAARVDRRRRLALPSADLPGGARTLGDDPGGPNERARPGLSELRDAGGSRTFARVASARSGADRGVDATSSSTPTRPPTSSTRCASAARAASAPAACFEQDDAENWIQVQRNLRGFVARRTRVQRADGTRRRAAA